MWNKFLGKKEGEDPAGNAADGAGDANPPPPSSTALTGGGASGDANLGDDVDVGGAPPAPSATTADPSITTDPDPAAIATKKKTLNAITQNGQRIAIRGVLVNDVNVSPPTSSGEEEDDDDVVEGGDGIERSFSGSTKTDTSISLLDQQDDKPEDNNNMDVEDTTTEVAAVAPRRGRSASVGEAGEVLPTEGRDADGLMREDSTASSDVPMTPSAGGGSGGAEGGGANFEASLLLGISAESTSTTGLSSGVTTPISEGKEKREPLDPTTLPTSMTSFLDMLTEDERRVRHRHIPGVDGFRKLYRSEVKADMSEARRMKRAKQLSTSSSSGGTDLTSSGDDVGENNNGTEAMDIDGEARGREDDNNLSSDNRNISEEQDEDNKKKSTTKPSSLPDRDAFIVPDKDTRACARSGQLASLIESSSFETTMDGSSNANKSASSTSSGPPPASSMRSTPRLVTSLTSFDPPRPQESTAAKTKHRLKRWETNPNEIETDLLSYRKTVNRTRMELHTAEKERVRIERVGGVMRQFHFMEHLNAYRKEILAMNEELMDVNGRCFKLQETFGSDERGVSTRGSLVNKGMKDVLSTLSGLGEDIKGVDTSSGGAPYKDWRSAGVGGVSSEGSTMASGWMLVGDEVIIASSGEEGTIVHIKGPEVIKSNQKKDDEDKKSPSKGSGGGGDAMDIDSPKKQSDDSKKEDGSNTKKDSKASTTTVVGTTIGVKLAKDGTIKSLSPAELKFNPKKLPTLLVSDPTLAQRWETMIQTALANGVSHDVLAMDEYINSSFIEKNKAVRTMDEDIEKEISSSGDDKDKESNNEGGSSPKSVAQYEDERSLLPFGSGMILAPKDLCNYPSVIPLDNLEETVRTVVYEADGPRVIPTMSNPVRKYEAQAEEMNALRGKVLQLRNRLIRQKRLRSLNERSLVAGKSRAHKVEGLLLEMQMDLKNLKERLQDELNELGIGNSPMPSAESENDVNDTEMNPVDDGAPKEDDVATKGNIPADDNNDDGADKGAEASANAKDDEKDKQKGADDAPAASTENQPVLEPQEEKPKEESAVSGDKHPVPSEGAENQEPDAKRPRVEE